jgi:hypothetical protein
VERLVVVGGGCVKMERERVNVKEEEEGKVEVDISPLQQKEPVDVWMEKWNRRWKERS